MPSFLPSATVSYLFQPCAALLQNGYQLVFLLGTKHGYACLTKIRDTLEDG